MTTEHRRRRHPAQAARRLAGGASVAALLGLVAGWSATADPPTAPAPVNAGIRVVITDPAIDREVAVAAALDAAAAGIDHVTVPVAGTASGSGTQVSGPAHSTTRAS